MDRYEMDPASVVEDTKWTWFRPEMDRQIDRQGETSISPFNFVEVGGIITMCKMQKDIKLIITTWLTCWQSMPYKQKYENKLIRKQAYIFKGHCLIKNMKIKCEAMKTGKYEMTELFCVIDKANINLLLSQEY